MASVTLTIEEDLLKKIDLPGDDAGKLQTVVALYLLRNGRADLSRCAPLAGLSEEALVDLAVAKGISLLL